MNKELFESYSKLNREIELLEEKKEKLKIDIIEEMEKEEVDKINAEYGTFFFSIRKSWKYSDAVKKLADKLSEKKKEEEQTGTAEATESKSLTFRPTKIVEN